jgi:hypothetical protein
MRRHKESKHFMYDLGWFVFPLAVQWWDKCYEYTKPTSRLSVHFLWWHWHWEIERKRW